MGPETHVLQKDVATSHAPPSGGALDYHALSASPMDGTGAGQSRRAPDLTLEANDGQWQVSETEAARYRKRMLAKLGGDTNRQLAFTDAELEEFIAHAKGLGFATADIEAILTVKLRKPDVRLSGLKKVASSLAEKRKEKRIRFKEGWDFMSVYRAAQNMMLHGKRLPPSEYLENAYSAARLEAFAGKASYLTTGTNYNFYIATDDPRFRELGYMGALYVSTSEEIDRVLELSGGDIAKIEVCLGIPKGNWQNKGGLYRIDIIDPEKKGLRIPDGGEASANEFWTPGALTSGGFAEGVLDQVPKTNENFKATQVIF
jgi:hypothetical protein